MSEAVAFLPGLMCDTRLFAAQAEALGRERAVIQAPLRGDRIEEIASTLLDALPRRVALVGHGMGGNVALEIVRRAPDRVARLCLMDTQPLAETPARAAERELLIARVRAGRLDEVMREELRAELFAPGPDRLHLQGAAREMARAMGAERFVQQSRAMMRRRDQQGELRRIKCPTLVMCGALDPLFPPKRHEFMAGLIEGARLEVIEDAGHMPSLERPEAVTDLLRDWLGLPLVLR